MENYVHICFDNKEALLITLVRTELVVPLSNSNGFLPELREGLSFNCLDHSLCLKGDTVSWLVCGRTSELLHNVNVFRSTKGYLQIGIAYKMKHHQTKLFSCIVTCVIVMNGVC